MLERRCHLFSAIRVILYARTNARKCARESEEEMKKKMRFLDTDTKVEALKIGEIGLQTFIIKDDAFKLVLWL
jgi:hypothetical protein